MKQIIKFLEFIRDEHFYLYKDGRWYSTKNRDYRFKATLYTDEQLFDYWFENFYKKQL